MDIICINRVTIELISDALTFVSRDRMEASLGGGFEGAAVHHVVATINSFLYPVFSDSKII
jgi:hypothetical protein